MKTLMRVLVVASKKLIGLLRPEHRSRAFRRVMYFLAAVACLVNTAQAAVEGGSSRWFWEP